MHASDYKHFNLKYKSFVWNGISLRSDRYVDINCSAVMCRPIFMSIYQFYLKICKYNRSCYISHKHYPTANTLQCTDKKLIVNKIILAHNKNSLKSSWKMILICYTNYSTRAIYFPCLTQNVAINFDHVPTPLYSPY